MDPELIFILIFILAPLIERLLNAGKKKKPPQMPPRPPQQRLPERDVEERPRVVIARREQESAAEMLPDDLWEILTGERRTPRVPSPPPPEPMEEEEAWSLEADSSEDWFEETAPETATLPSTDVTTGAALELPVPRARFERPVPARAAPETVSLEKLEIDGHRRHEQFHERLNRLRTQRVARTGGVSTWSFRSAAEARRAIIMSEILGPPKGLE